MHVVSAVLISSIVLLVAPAAYAQNQPVNTNVQPGPFFNLIMALLSAQRSNDQGTAPSQQQAQLTPLRIQVPQAQQQPSAAAPVQLAGTQGSNMPPLFLIPNGGSAAQQQQRPQRQQAQKPAAAPSSQQLLQPAHIQFLIGSLGSQQQQQQQQNSASSSSSDSNNFPPMPNPNFKQYAPPIVISRPGITYGGDKPVVVGSALPSGQGVWRLGQPSQSGQYTKWEPNSNGGSSHN